MPAKPLASSEQAAEINDLLASGDFNAALDTVEGPGNETLTEAMQALADAASGCNVAQEPNSGDIIVYRDDAEVIEETTNVIPFINMTHAFTYLRLGFVDRPDNPNGCHDASPTAVQLAADGQSRTWEANSANTVTVPGNNATTWAPETALTDKEIAASHGGRQGAARRGDRHVYRCWKRQLRLFAVR